MCHGTRFHRFFSIKFPRRGHYSLILTVSVSPHSQFGAGRRFPSWELLNVRWRDGTNLSLGSGLPGSGLPFVRLVLSCRVSQ